MPIENGDKWAKHSCRKPCKKQPKSAKGKKRTIKYCIEKHSSSTCSGSGKVYINGVSAARVTDSVCCSSKIVSGSSNVYMG